MRDQKDSFWIDSKKMLTLVIMVLVGVVSVKLVQQLDHVGVGSGATELIACAIEAENELVRLPPRRRGLDATRHGVFEGLC